MLGKRRHRKPKKPALQTQLYNKSRDVRSICLQIHVKAILTQQGFTDTVWKLELE